MRRVVGAFTPCRVMPINPTQVPRISGEITSCAARSQCHSLRDLFHVRPVVVPSRRGGDGLRVAER